LRLRSADIGRPIADIRLNLTVEEIEPMLHEVLETLVVKEFEVQDRSGRWHLLRLRPYRTSENKIEGVVLLLLDIDQMQRTQEALQQARDFAQTVLESVPIPVVVVDGELRTRTANAAFRAISGLTSADLENRAFVELVKILWQWPDLRESLIELLRQPNGAVLDVEHETARPAARVLKLIARSILTESEPLILILIEDVTTQRMAERVLESERENLAGQVRSTAEVLGRTKEELRALTARLFTSQEDEKRRVARELHDDIGQKLALLEIDLERLQQSLPADAEQLAKSLRALQQQAGTLSTDVRNLSHEIHPSALEHLGLPSALNALVKEFGEREGMVATFRRRGVPDALPHEVATALYRIAQEALRNVAKHAGRTHVKVALEGSGDSVRLSIRDSGEGFDLDGTMSRGLGLVSMEERARLVGGTLTVESELGQGTAVTATVPAVEAEASTRTGAGEAS
jgi:two-component system CheB/CheR fusion protein